MRASRAAILDRPWPVIGGVMALLAIAWYLTSRPQTHSVKVAFGEALNITDGALVQSAGITVGHAKDIHYEDGQAVMRLELEDEIWPLPKGTTAQIRLSSVSGNVNRRVALILGPRGAAPIPEGGVIGTAQSKPVELDEIFNTFDPGTRDTLRGSLTNLADGLGGHTAQLNAGIGKLAPTVEQVGGLMSDLNASQRQLSSLVRNGDKATGILAAKRQRVGDVVDLASATFQTFGERTGKVTQTLEALPGALAQIKSTTRRLRPSLVRLTDLMDDLAPGAAELTPTARILAPTLALLRPTAVDGSRLAANVTQAAPSITRLLMRGQPFVRDLTPIVDKLTPIVDCVRPYTPELAGTLSNWASWNANYDATGNIARIFVDAAGVGDLADSPEIPATAFKSLGMSYAALRPHGWIANQPQYDDKCGVGKAGVDPNNEWPDR
jgi:virulence factor Mce-like protein